MDIKELDKKIVQVKERTPDVFNDVLYLVVPFYLLHQKVFQGTIKIQEQKYHISNSEFDVMRCLYMSRSEDNILSPTKIYEKLMFTSGAITKVLKKLEEKEYIIRLDNKFDKRSKLVQLTPLGHTVCKEVLIDVFAFEEKCFSVLKDKQKAKLRKLMLKVLEGV